MNLEPVNWTFRSETNCYYSNSTSTSGYVTTSSSGSFIDVDQYYGDLSRLYHHHAGEAYFCQAPAYYDPNCNNPNERR